MVSQRFKAINVKYNLIAMPVTHITLTKNCLWRISIARNVHRKRSWKVDRFRDTQSVG